MKSRKTLAQRREELLTRSTLQRATLSARVQLMRHSMSCEHIGSTLLADFKENMLLIAAAAVAVVVIKPRRIISGLKAALLTWQTVRNVLPLLQNFLKRP